MKSVLVAFLILSSVATMVKAQESNGFLGNRNRPKGLFNPFYFRAGLTSGVLTGGGMTSTVGLRTEYGLSKILSVVGDIQTIRGNAAFSGGQGTLAIRYAPFALNRFQPYASAGFGVGSGIPGHGRHCHNQQVQATTMTQTTGDVITPTQEEHRRLVGLAVLHVGTNFKVSSHMIAQAEAVFQTQISRHPETGGTGFRMGLAYQFGKN